MDRRDFLGTAAATALLAGAQPAAAAFPPLEGGRPFRTLPEVRSRDGRLVTELHVRPETVDVGGRSLRLNTYNGALPGMTVRVRPGDRLEWTLKNDLEPLGLPPGETGLPDALKVLSYTNVHVHGLQVSPRDGADNVYITVEKGRARSYRYDIPGPETGRPQPAGLYWYHPHRHGSTSNQAWNGLAGPIVVEGDIDEVPEVAAARERIMVLNGLWLNERGETPSARVVPIAGPSPFTPVPATPTEMIFPINGVYQPTIDIRPGETQRWRVLAAAPHRFFHLALDGHLFYQIGQDGIPFAETRSRRTILLAPGNRAEFIVKGGPPGRYALRALAYDQGHPGGARPERLLATVVSSGAPEDGKLPGKLVEPPTIPAGRETPVGERTVRFSGDIAAVPVQFFLDGKKFSAERIDQTVLVDTTEDWTLVNEDVFQHPFHIHVNPFQVIEINGQPTGDPTWWDTFPIPSRGSAKLRMYFRKDVTGLTVYHCHILPHEDAGMMANILLFDPPGGIGPGAGE